jgi:hypothetical protein
MFLNLLENEPLLRQPRDGVAREIVAEASTSALAAVLDAPGERPWRRLDIPERQPGQDHQRACGRIHLDLDEGAGAGCVLSQDVIFIVLCVDPVMTSKARYPPVQRGTLHPRVVRYYFVKPDTVAVSV